MAHISQITIGSNSYWVYGDTAEFKTYMAGRLGADAYDAADGTMRKKAQVQATRWIDRLRWDGLRTDPTTPQPLAFPRIGLTNCDGEAVSSVTAPEEVIEASYELALILLGDGSASDSASTAKNIKSVGAGSAQVEFFRVGDSTGSKGSKLPTAAWSLVKCFAGAGSQANSGAISSGTDECSQFDSNDVYDLRHGEGFP